MRLLFGTILAGVAVAALPLCAADGDLLAETETAAAFRLYLTGSSTYALESADEIAAWPVTWRAGETVTATAWDGTAVTLADGGTDAARASLPSGRGGVWTLANAAQGTARVGVPWAVYGDGAAFDFTGGPAAFGADFMADGPDRTSVRGEVLPVAYSGDGWLGDATAASTLTFGAPDGAETTFNLSGTGTVPFTFGAPGRWMVRLGMADGTTRTATVRVSGGMTILIR